MIHDWTRVPAGIFHAFHLEWIGAIAGALNKGVLPRSYYALPEQVASGLGPDVLTLRRPTSGKKHEIEDPVSGGIALAIEPPAVRIHMRAEANRYAAKARTIVIRHISNHDVVAMIEIVSPGNKNSAGAIRSFIRRAREMLAAGIHLLVIDVFPPGPRDPHGIHEAIWAEECDETYQHSDNEPLVCVSYIGGAGSEAFVEPLAVGSALPDMPLFLTPEFYIRAPLEATYQQAWESMPEYWCDVLTGKTEHE
jgi:hypothetical protein